MIKTALIGLWAAVIALASSYLTASGTLGAMGLPGAGGGEEAVGGIDYVKTGMTSIPVIRNGEIKGYVIIQLAFATDTALVKKLPVDPTPFLIDEAFRMVFDNTRSNFANLDTAYIAEFSNRIAANANKRLGAGLIKDVLIQQLNYIRKEDVRKDMSIN